eukprot:1644032-Rhodomonas_salina.2
MPQQRQYSSTPVKALYHTHPRHRRALRAIKMPQQRHYPGTRVLGTTASQLSPLYYTINA